MLAGGPAEDMKRTREGQNHGAISVQSSDQTLSLNKHPCVQKKNSLNGIIQSLQFWSRNGNNSNNNEDALKCEHADVLTSSTDDDLVSRPNNLPHAIVCASYIHRKRIAFVMK